MRTQATQTEVGQVRKSLPHLPYVTSSPPQGEKVGTTTEEREEEEEGGGSVVE